LVLLRIFERLTTLEDLPHAWPFITTL
jgi:hypothetical protein